MTIQKTKSIYETKTTKGSYQMGRLKNLAKSATAMNAIMDGREKISVDDIIKFYPNGLTLNRVAMINKPDGNDYPAFTYVEDDTKFFTGGTALTKIVNSWLADLGDIETVNSELTAEPVKVKLTKIKTRNGHNFVKADIVD